MAHHGTAYVQLRDHPEQHRFAAGVAADSLVEDHGIWLSEREPQRLRRPGASRGHFRDSYRGSLANYQPPTNTSSLANDPLPDLSHGAMSHWFPTEA